MWSGVILTDEPDVVSAPNLRHVGDDHAIAFFQSGQDLNGAYGRATELHLDPRRIVPIVVEHEERNFCVRGAVYGPPDLQSAVDLFDVDECVYLQVCINAFGLGVQRDVDRTCVVGARWPDAKHVTARDWALLRCD